MDPDTSNKLLELLRSYNGPETGLVRTALALLAQDDVQKLEYYLKQAHHDYRQLLLLSEMEHVKQRSIKALSGMTVNERLCECGLFEKWERAVHARDRKAMISILVDTSLTEKQAAHTVDAVLGRPQNYGF